MFECSKWTIEITEAVVPLVSSDPSGWNKISAEKALLVTVWYLANKETFRQISDRFDIAESCAHTIIKKVTKFFTVNSTDSIRWPNENELPNLAANFMKKKNIPGVIGAIGGSHIPIRRPTIHEEDYMNRKGFHSILLQDIVDHQTRFRNIYVGEPGSVHDARMLRRSKIYQVGNDIPHGYIILGDSAYPMLRWLIPPYKDNGNLTDNQKTFNYKHSATRIVVEHAYGKLKGRFRRLQHFDNTDLTVINYCVATACILHNICIDQNDLGEDLIDENDNADVINDVCGNDEVNENDHGHRNRLLEAIMNNA